MNPQVVVGLALSSVLIPACDASQPVNQVFEVLELDLGLVRDPLGDHLFQTEIENTEAQSWMIDRFVPSCGCIRVLTPSCRVDPGERFLLKIAFEPRGIRGLVDQDLMVVLDSGRMFPLANFSGIVVPEGYVEPETLYFADGVLDSQRLELTLPTPTAEVSVLESPAFVAVREVSRRIRHGALQVNYELEILETTSGGADRGIRISALVYDQEVEHVVPVLRPQPLGPILRSKLLLVPGEGEVGSRVSIRLRRNLSNEDLATARVSVTPSSSWHVELGTDRLDLERLGRHLEVPTVIALQLEDRHETLRLQPRTSSPR